MAAEWKPEKQRYVITEDLVINTSGGVVGRNGKRFNDYNLKPDDRFIRIQFELPSDFFKPVQVRVDFPEELKMNKVIEGAVTEVAIPVVVANKDEASKVIVRETIDSAPSNFLAMLKRRVVQKLGIEEKKGTNED